MRVFILCTGRSGSSTLIRACQHIVNYTAAHESKTREFGSDRFEFNDFHIEGDNRLSWHLGELEQIYGNEAFYVHLKRDRNRVASSFMKRFHEPSSMIDAFCEGLHKKHPSKMTKQERLQACNDYVNTVTRNVELFLKNKSKQMTLHLENINEEFPLFWEKIGAKGSLDLALAELKVKHNASSGRAGNFLYRYKLLLKGELRHLKMWLGWP